MSPMHHESNFEGAITSSLVSSGWRERFSQEYDRQLGLNPAELGEFVKATQPKEWARLLQLQSGEEASAARRLAEVVAQADR